MNRLTHDEVRLRIGVSAEALYDLVSDVTRTPQWSPEVISCHWIGDATDATETVDATGPAAGARFVARNRRRWFTWSNRPVVEVADRAREFAFTRTEPGGGTIRWYYRLTSIDGGVHVEHGYQVIRPVSVGLHIALRLLFGVRDLRADLHQNIATSLRRLAAVAEGQSRSDAEPTPDPPDTREA